MKNTTPTPTLFTPEDIDDCTVRAGTATMTGTDWLHTGSTLADRALYGDADRPAYVWHWVVDLEPGVSVTTSSFRGRRTLVVPTAAISHVRREYSEYGWGRFE
jgi:hypothetical protein